MRTTARRFEHYIASLRSIRNIQVTWCRSRSFGESTNKTVVMAYALRSGLRVFRQFPTLSVKSNRLASLEGLISRRWVAAGSSEHTLAVRQQIQDTRKKGQEAGGAKRIESQHKKVIVRYPGGCGVAGSIILGRWTLSLHFCNDFQGCQSTN